MPFPVNVQEQALRALEWDTLLSLLAKEAHTSMGAERCRTVALAERLEDADTRMQETAEMCLLADNNVPFPPVAFTDLRQAIVRLAKGAIWEAHEFRDLSAVFATLRHVQYCLSYHQAQTPCLWSIIHVCDDMSSLKTSIDQCIDADGHVLDSATPSLYETIQEVQRLRNRLRHCVESMLASTGYEAALQERSFAIRGGRYVLPIKVEKQEHVSGIVHDVSASGATVFLEPRELVAMNNQLKVAEVQVHREVQQILQNLSRTIANHGQPVAQILDVLAELDCIAAKARLSRKMRGKAVRLNEQGHIALRQACHPLLVLAGKQVVANDVMLGSGQHVLVISGPNTGGKTVNLKLLGLFAFMVRAGLHPPCTEDSEMAFFPRIYADIGDAQDITKNLSSFSAHILNIICLLETTTVSGEVPSNTLVLIDEIVGSTDPAEGAALAIAILHRLIVLGFKVVVTTHYNALKTLAVTYKEFVNASLEFDVNTLSPTYRLLHGLPGSSSALQIAACLGMDQAIVDQAWTLVRGEDRHLEQIFRELHMTQTQLKKELEQAASFRLEAERASLEVQEIADRHRNMERQEHKRVQRQLTAELGQARTEIHRIVDELKKEHTLQKAKDSRDRLSVIQHDVSQHLQSASENIPCDQLEAGDWVEIGGFGTYGVLVESPKGKKHIHVRVEGSVLSVRVSLLIGKKKVDDLSGTLTSSKKVLQSRDPSPQSFSQTSSFPSVDLRGQSIDEALDCVLRTLDQAALNGTFSICLLHGHGTGKLKSAIRHYLSSSPYVERFRAGVKEEGGDGVTIVKLQ